MSPPGVQVPRDGAAERRPGGHPEGVPGGAGASGPPAPTHRHREAPGRPGHHLRSRLHSVPGGAGALNPVISDPDYIAHDPDYIAHLEELERTTYAN